mgnify:CR=1 FL=1
MPALAASAAELSSSAKSALQKLTAQVPAAKALARDAKAVLVFPKVTKAGFGIGGQYGDGALIQGGKVVGYYNTAGASFGLQAGAQTFGYALFFMNDNALAQLGANEGFEVGVGPSVVVGAELDPHHHLSAAMLAPHVKVLAPWRMDDFREEFPGRAEMIAYAEKHKIPVQASAKKPYSMDRNLWHLSHEGAELEDPWNEPSPDVLLLITPPEKAPDKPTYVELEFEQGVPVKLDGAALDPVALVEKLNEIAGANGVGIADMVENRLVGMKSRGVYETPGGTVLFLAHRELELLTLDRATLHFKEMVAARYAELVYDGVWFAPLREALDAFVDSTQRTVSGTVRMKLYKGNCTPAGVKSPYSLYDPELSTFSRDEVYNQRDAEGFINLFGLPLKVRALMKEKAGLG